MNGELALLREAISLAQCNTCEQEFVDDWIVVDFTEHYSPDDARDDRPWWMRKDGIWSVERKALLCAWCAALNNNRVAPHLSVYRNHRGPGVRLLDAECNLIEVEAIP